jgi:hypothetical protein
MDQPIDIAASDADIAQHGIIDRLETHLMARFSEDH